MELFTTLDFVPIFEWKVWLSLCLSKGKKDEIEKSIMKSLSMKDLMWMGFGWF